METTTRVLVIRFSSMGDIILTSPVVRAVHVLLDGAVEVHVLTKAAFSDAVTGLDGVVLVIGVRLAVRVHERRIAQQLHLPATVIIINL